MHQSNAFLKECELILATGQESEIYDFKVKELQYINTLLLDHI